MKTNSGCHQSLSPITGEKSVAQTQDSGTRRFVSAASDSLTPAMKSKPPPDARVPCVTQHSGRRNLQSRRLPGASLEEQLSTGGGGRGSEISPSASWKAFLLRGNGSVTWGWERGGCGAWGVLRQRMSLLLLLFKTSSNSHVLQAHAKRLLSGCSEIKFCTHQEKEY